MPGHPPPLRVFLSHTAELRQYPSPLHSFVAAAEAAVCRSGNAIVDMAYLPASTHPPTALCRDAVQAADVFVLIAGFHYGSIVPDEPDVSYTEFEFRTAIEANKPLLVFLLDGDMNGPRALFRDPEFGVRQDSFRARLAVCGTTNATVTDPHQLETEVLDALRKLAPAVGPAVPAASNVPKPVATFTGRETLLEQIRSRLGPPGTAAVTALHGLGGVGKTQLAKNYAVQHADDYELAWWIDAEQPAVLQENLAALAPRLGLPVSGVVTHDAYAVREALRHRKSWLLVFDNAEDPGALGPWLPSGTGHVLITSRTRAWDQLASTVDVEVMDTEDAVHFLRSRISGLEPGLAGDLAAELGGLPLAMEQAAAYIESNDTSAATYLADFCTRRSQMLPRGRDDVHGASIATVWALSLARLTERGPAAAQLLKLCAQLGPEPVPLDVFVARPSALLAPLRNLLDGPDADLELTELIGAARRYSLVSRDGGTVTMHRLLAAVIRADQDAGRQAAAARTLLAAAARADPADPAGWPRWALLAPHVVAAPAWVLDDDSTEIDKSARELLLATCRYFHARGQFDQAYDVASRTRQRWYRTLGEYDRDTMRMANCLANAIAGRRIYDEARKVNRANLRRQVKALGSDDPDTLQTRYDYAGILRRQGEHKSARAALDDVLQRQTRILGDDHPDTLRTANELAGCLYDLGQIQAARELNENTLARRRELLGVEHPDTLQSTHNLASALARLDQLDAAWDLYADAHTRRRQLLGADHPDTLQSANGLAVAWRRRGRHDVARDLHQDTLTRRQRVLGADHPDTLHSANGLAAALGSLGELSAARERHEDTLERWRRLRDGFGEDHPDVLRLAFSLAATWTVLGDDRSALGLHEDTRIRRRRLLGRLHPDTQDSKRAVLKIRDRLSELEDAAPDPPPGSA